ncbi:MAG: hypothetical protein QG641_293 [Candidatus Poribacteria bacterium]|nr:hypothetical protein [Candidatus Poribacteria bacterium]
MTHTDNRIGSSCIMLLISLTVLSLAVYGCKDIVSHFMNKSDHELITENKELKKAITNLTTETMIGYAKVITQEKRDGRLFTRLRFVETDRNDDYSKVLEKEYEIEGDIIHFDALVIKFSNQMVLDGKEKSLYLWRRIYGEKMNPSDGFSIEVQNEEPKRYSDILEKLSLDERKQFWAQIWELSNDPDRLKKQGIVAVYGNVIYKNLKPHLVYIFRINNAGGLYPEVIPDF